MNQDTRSSKGSAASESSMQNARRPLYILQPTQANHMARRTFRGGCGPRLQLQVVSGELKLGALLVGILALRQAGAAGAQWKR